MKFTIRVWRQSNGSDKGRFESYDVDGISADESFLEMLDILNDQILQAGQEPVAFDNDCREGICGSCSMVINGVAHGHEPASTACQVFMRDFENGSTITVEPWRAKAFPVMKDLVVDRGAFDRIIQAGGYVSVNCGGAPDGNSVPISKEVADAAMDAAACIGCGACVAACKNASASLFVGAKVTQLALLPQGRPERERRVAAMVKQMEAEGFGACSNEGECEAVCPKEISIRHIATMHREYMKAALKGYA